MGKISPVSIKYTIFAKFTAEGPVEKPDVIGAVFGQTEGLLGEDLELRELQKNGKIGRIEVDITLKDSKAEGMIQIPTSIDKTETAIIASAIETIDRIGPCSAKVEIEKIDDVRGSKREYVLARAKALLEKMSVEAPDSREMQSAVSSSARTGRIMEYGEEKLPAGPDMDNPEIIVVEGRADVVNLLNYNIKNVIAMNGASLPKTITELGKTKEITLFVDGDRGGELITKDALANATISFVAQAPPGKEVEELVGKEIQIALRSRMPASDVLRELSGKSREYIREPRTERLSSDSEEGGRGRGRYSSRGRGRESSYGERNERNFNRSRYGSEGDNGYGSAEDNTPMEKVGEASAEERVKLNDVLTKIQGTNAACLLDENLEVIKKVPGYDLPDALRRSRAYAVVFDGLATMPIIRSAERARVKRFVAKNFASLEQTNMDIVSL